MAALCEQIISIVDRTRESFGSMPSMRIGSEEKNVFGYNESKNDTELSKRSK